MISLVVAVVGRKDDNMTQKTPSKLLKQALADMKQVEREGKTIELVNSNAFKDFQTELTLCLADDVTEH